LLDRNQQPRGCRPQGLRQWGRPPGIEVELNAELSEPGEFASGVWIAHPMNETDRGIAEMHEPGFDEQRRP